MAKINRMNYWATYSIIGVMVVAGILFAGFIYEHNKLVNEEVVESTDKQIVSNDKSLANLKSKQVGEDESPSEAWNSIYPNTVPMEIADVTVSASIAQTWAERIQGLSGTPYLPDHVVKLFIFDANGFHSIWMKDMNYSIDIIWVDEAKTIVHIAKDISPDSYPESFTPDKPAYYVIETVAGFVDKNDIAIGDTVTIPRRR